MGEQKEVVRQEQKSTFESTQTASFSSSTSSKVETKIESAGGEERRAEALARRREFLKQQEDLRMKVSSSQFSTVQSKTRQQLEEEREAMFAASVKRVQEESRMQMERAKMEEQKRIDFLKQEEERLKREEVLRQEAMIRAEEERKRKEMERKEEEEERIRLEKMRREEERQVSVKKTEIISRQEESNNMEEMKRLHEQKILERQRLEMMISQESKVTSGQVSKRADDVHGLGWGNVTTGFVNRKKLGFLQRATDSMERDWSAEASPAPSAGRRVTWADSSSGSRPDSRLQEVDTVRVQTPPLAGEWAVARSAEMSVSQQSSSFSHQQTGGGVQFAGQSSVHASAFSSTQQASSSQQISSMQQMSSSSSSSSHKTSFSQSTSSSFQSSSIEASKAFEAFPGMNGIENLRLEQ